MKIEIEDRDALIGEVARAVTYEVLSDLRERIDRTINDAIREALNESARLLAVEELRPRVREVLDGAWVESDSYGAERKYTLKEMIARFFKPGSYGSSRTWITELVEATTRDVMKAAFQPEIDAAKKHLREKLDTILGEKVALAVREAVGLR